MIRKIIKINKEKCNGCGLCVKACHEGAIGLIDNKAELLRDDYCDGLGACLPVCPTNAIEFEEREAIEYDEKSVLENKKTNEKVEKLPCGCPGTNSKKIIRKPVDFFETDKKSEIKTENNIESQLSQWPVQIKLVNINAPYFKDANLLIAADCCAYAYANFHNDYIKNRITLIGCPKLDDIDYSEKLTAILKNNSIKSITVVRMEVPCCAGIVAAVKKAIMDSGNIIPFQITVISTDGKILEN